MSQQQQTQQGTGETGAQTAQLQQTLMENGRKAMRQFFELPIQQTLQFQRSAVELFVNSMEAQQLAQDRRMELTRETMHNYLRTLDSVAQNTEELAQAEMATAQQQGQAMQQATSGLQGNGQQTSQQQPGPQQPQAIGPQAWAGGHQKPQPIQQPQGMGQQPPQIGQQPQGMGPQQPPRKQGIRQPLGQQPAARAEGEQPAPKPEPAETTRPEGRGEGRPTGAKSEGAGRPQQESLTETQ